MLSLTTWWRKLWDWFRRAERSAEQPSAAPATPRRGERSLSPTALNKFLDCEKQFEFAYLLKADVHRPPSAELIFGNALHQALAFLHRLPKDYRTLENTSQALRNAWGRAKGRDEAFLDREEEQIWGERALRTLKAYFDRYDVMVRPLRVEEWIRAELPNGQVVAGKADRIDRVRGLSPGLEVIDYKAGKCWIDDEDLPRDLAARLYALAAARTLRRPVVRVRLIYLTAEVERIWNVEQEDLAAIEEQLVELTDRVRSTTNFRAFPGDPCRYCDYATICDERDQANLAELAEKADVPF